MANKVDLARRGILGLLNTLEEAPTKNLPIAKPSPLNAAPLSVGPDIPQPDNLPTDAILNAVADKVSNYSPTRRAFLRQAASAALPMPKLPLGQLVDAPLIETVVENYIPTNMMRSSVLNKMFDQSPKLRQFMAKSLQKDVVENMSEEPFGENYGAKEMIEDGFEDFYFKNDIDSLNKVFKEHSNLTEDVAVYGTNQGPFDFDQMPTEFVKDAENFISGNKLENDEMFAEFLETYRSDYLKDFPKESVREADVYARKFIRETLQNEYMMPNDSLLKMTAKQRERDEKILDDLIETRTIN